MTLQQIIENDYKAAFKASKKDVVSALRMLKSSIKNREIEVGRELTDAETVDIVSREVKRRNDAAAQYQKAGRIELVAHEMSDVAAYKKYLPAQLSAEELSAIVKETVAALGASDASQTGKVMGAVMAKVKGRADGTAVKALVQQAFGT